MTVYQEFIAFSNTAKNLRVVQNQTGAFVTGLAVKEQSSGKTSHPAAYNDAIEDFSGFVYFP